MPSYENEVCPVCDRKFTSEDDIVTCPHCGTPHHRECYNSVGHCANIDKHGTDFAFTPTAVNESDAQNDETFCNNTRQSTDYYYHPSAENSDEKTRCVKCNAEIDKNASVCDKCGAQQPSSRFGDYKSPADFNMDLGAVMKTGYENSTEQIDGKSVSDAADVVRTNTHRFIPKFLENKRFSWNWGAFVFGPFYLFFRKMYKEGAIFFALRLIVSLIAQGIYAEPYAKFYSFVSSNYESLTANPTDTVIDQAKSLYQAVLPMFLIILGANLILHLIIAVFSDGFYREKVISVLTKVDQRLEEGGMFNQSFTMMDGDVNLSQADMKRLYLGKLGGTSFFSPVMAFFIYDFIVSIISSL